MRIALVVALLGIGAVACSYTSYTPPARMMPLETAVAPARGASDVQLEASSSAAMTFWGGFSAQSGAARLRGGLTDRVSISAEGGVISVDGDTTNTIDHTADVGRVGVNVHEADRSPGAHVAFTGGVGGGRSTAAGNWISEDAGVIVSGNGHWFVPYASLEGFASQPVDARPFDYVDAHDNSTHSDILTNTAGFRITSGFELRDGDAADSQIGVIVGFMMGGIWKRDSGDGFAGLGVAVRVAI
jgi:hypothetical protein